MDPEASLKCLHKALERSVCYRHPILPWKNQSTDSSNRAVEPRVAPWHGLNMKCSQTRVFEYLVSSWGPVAESLGGGVSLEEETARVSLEVNSLA